MDGHFLLMFPSKESQTAMWAKEFRLFTNSESLLHLEQKRADLAEDLRTFHPVVEVEINAWRPAAWADDVDRNQ